MTQNDNEARLRRLYEGVWNGTDPSVADELVALEYVIHDRAISEELRGPELYRTLAEMTRELFPAAAFAIDDVVADERVALRWTMTGTHEGSLVGEEPTGKEVELTAVEMDASRMGSWSRRGPRATCSACWSRSGRCRQPRRCSSGWAGVAVVSKLPVRVFEISGVS